MKYFGLKLGQDLGNRAAHPYQKFQGVSPPPPPGLFEARILCQWKEMQCSNKNDNICERKSKLRDVRKNPMFFNMLPVYCFKFRMFIFIFSAKRNNTNCKRKLETDRLSFSPYTFQPIRSAHAQNLELMNRGS